MNEYTTEASVAGQTEWVVTFPTKRFYVHDIPEEDFPDGYIRPFTTAWAPISEGVPATACEVVELNLLWDREEQYDPEEGCEDTPEGCDKPPVVSPPRPGDDIDEPGEPFELCYETNVIRFGDAEDDDGNDILPDATEILGADTYLNFDNTALDFQYGWARLELDDYVETTAVLDDDDNVVDYVNVPRSRYAVGNHETGDPLNGLPFVGFAVTRFSNGFITPAGDDAQTVFSSYGGLFKHKSSRKMGSDLAPPPVVEPLTE